jgi:sialate O-acetylesterase
MRRGLPWLRESLLSSLKLPATGIAVSTDLGIPDDRYPPDKLDVGRRLARLARHRIYGEEIPDSGPTLQRLKIEGNKIRLGFDSHGGGLTVGLSPASTEGGNDAGTRIVSSLKGFALSGANRKWFPATGRIEGDDVILSSDAVPHPEAVRYNWKGYPVGNLYNREGLPAPPFRTDTDQPK